MLTLFESYLAQLGDYDESYYLDAFYFWTPSRNNERRIYSAAGITLGCKEYGGEVRVDSSGYIRAT